MKSQNVFGRVITLKTLYFRFWLISAENEVCAFQNWIRESHWHRRTWPFVRASDSQSIFLVEGIREEVYLSWKLKIMYDTSLAIILYCSICLSSTSKGSYFEYRNFCCWPAASCFLLKLPNFVLHTGILWGFINRICLGTICCFSNELFS